MIFKKTFFIASLMFVCAAPQTPTDKTPSDPRADFAWKYYNVSFNKSRNTVQSPYALRTILTFLANTANPDASQWRKAVSLNNLDGANARFKNMSQRFRGKKAFRMDTLAFINSDDSLSAQLEKAAEMYNIFLYRQTIERVGKPKVAQDVNSWMKRSTRNPSLRIITKPNSVSENYKLTIFNSALFAGVWKYSFEDDFSKTCYFHPDYLKKQMVEYMYLEEMLRSGRFPEYNLNAVELPFQTGSPFSSIFMMPIEGRIEQMITKLNHGTFANIFTKLRVQKTAVELPSFTIANNIKAKRGLQKMGLGTLFGGKALQIFGGESVPLGDTVQMAVIQVKTNGTRKAQMLVDRASPFYFNGNRPFVFVIFDKVTLVPIMIGHYVVPERSSVMVDEKNYNELLCHVPRENYSI